MEGQNSIFDLILANFAHIGILRRVLYVDRTGRRDFINIQVISLEFYSRTVYNGTLRNRQAIPHNFRKIGHHFLQHGVRSSHSLYSWLSICHNTSNGRLWP